MVDVYRKRKWICFALAMLCLFGPILCYFTRAFIVGDTGQKLTLGLTFAVAFIFTVINAAKKTVPRSAIWFLLLGLHYVFVHFHAMILIFAITTILEELIFWPLYKYYKEKLDKAQLKKDAATEAADLALERLQGA